MRLLPSDHKCRLRGATLGQAIKDDRDRGLIPFYVSTYTMLSKEYQPILLVYVKRLRVHPVMLMTSPPPLTL
jgi:hypothetical protein